MSHTSRVATLLACLVASAAHATTFVATSERALARAADAIVAGTVERIETVGGIDGAISTLVTVRVDGTYKGATAREIVLKQPGGDLGERAFWLAGSPRFVVGQRNVLFLSAGPDGTARTTALAMGQYVVEDEGGEAMATRALHEPVLGGARTRRLRLSRLARTIRRAVASDLGAAVRPLVTMPAEATAPGLERRSTDAFTYLDTPAGRWREPDADLPVTYQFTAGGDAGLGEVTSIGALDAALAAWTNASGASIVLSRGAAAEPAPLLCDGLSQIVFNDPYGEIPNPNGCSGVLALGGYCVTGRSSDGDVVGGVRFRRISEGNITFANGFGGCAFWNGANLAEILTHEIGHTIGIGHSSEADDESTPALKDATMYYRAHFDGRGASLRADDLAAVRSIYPDPDDPGAGPTDIDGDGVTDADDNCPGDDPTYGLANPAQTDTDGDGMGDLCDPCPLVPADAADPSCQRLAVSDFQARFTPRGNTLRWKGRVALDASVSPASARVMLVGGAGIVFDTAIASRAARLPGRLAYRGSNARIRLTRGRFGVYTVKVTARDVKLDGAPMPVVSANLQVGARSFTASLSCPTTSGRKLRCRS